MKITVDKKGNMLLEEVFNSIVFKTEDGEKMAICMRDSGFEFKYQDKWYFAKRGSLRPTSKKTRIETPDGGELDTAMYQASDILKKS